MATTSSLEPFTQKPTEKLIIVSSSPTSKTNSIIPTQTKDLGTTTRNSASSVSAFNTELIKSNTSAQHLVSVQNTDVLTTQLSTEDLSSTTCPNSPGLFQFAPCSSFSAFCRSLSQIFNFSLVSNDTMMYSAERGSEVTTKILIDDILQVQS